MSVHYDETCLQKNKRVTRKGEILVTSISPFPAMFSKVLFFGVAETGDSAVKVK